MYHDMLVLLLVEALPCLLMLKALLGEALTVKESWGPVPQACMDICISKFRSSLSGLVSPSSLVKKGRSWDMGHTGYTFSSSEAAVL